MLKKTLLATAVAALCSTPAFAMTLSTTDAGGDAATTSATGVISSGNYDSNVLATQTKQAVLDKTTFSGTITSNFTQTQSGTVEAELKDGGEVVLYLQGDAKFNADNIESLLKVSSNGVGAGILTGVTLPGIAVTITGNYSDDANGTNTAAIGSVGTAPAITSSSNADDLANIFKLTNDGTNTYFDYSLSADGKELSLKLADAVGNTAVAVKNPDYTTAGAAVYSHDGGTTLADFVQIATANVTFDFQSSGLQQAFTLTSGTSSDVSMKIGALQNASYTADPIPTPTMFKFDNLFSLEEAATPLNDDGSDATALVSTTYTQWDTQTADTNGDDIDEGTPRVVTLTNNTTNQNIQHRFLELAITGDFSGIATTSGGFLADGSGTSTGWKVSGDSATITYSDLTDITTNTAGGTNFTLDLPTFFLDPENTANLDAQNFSLAVTQSGASATFNEYTQTIGDYFIVKRNGLKFDTITTGTTSANVIYIRDVSNALPTDGGTIYVTITEYDAHNNDANGDGTVLVSRQALTTKLPSNGAVTLTPAGVAADVGAEIAAGRQARFLFEVETEKGEAAVKKATSGGVDIQNGTKGTGEIVDFTL